MKLLFRTLAGSALLALAACDSDSDEGEQRTAVGQILPGSTTDAMIPYDQLRSQPPLAPPTGASVKPGGVADSAAEDTATDAAQEEAGAPSEAAPAEPSPTPTE